MALSDLLRDLIGVVQQAPLWLRLGVAIWLVTTACVAAAFLLIPKSVTRGVPVAQVATASRKVSSHSEAAEAGLLVLDCSRYRIAAMPGLSIGTDRLCDALAELRKNMSHLARLRLVLVGKAGDVPSGELAYDATAGLLKDYKEEQYGVKKGALLHLISELRPRSESLTQQRSAQMIAQWNIQSAYTLDDIFVANGFLDWVIGHRARELSPGEVFRLGPFYDLAFPKTETSSLVLRAFKDVVGGDSVDYVGIVGLYD